MQAKKKFTLHHFKRLKALFEILPSGIQAEHCILVCEISKDSFCYTIKDVDKNMCMAVAAYNLDTFASVEDNSYHIDEMIRKQLVFTNAFKKVCIVYAYPESVLIPFSLYNSSENDNVVDLIHGDLTDDCVTLTDLITERKCYNTYRVPVSILKVMSAQFPNAENAHQYSLLLRKDLAGAGYNLLLIFYSEKMVVRLQKDDSPEFINTFFYNTLEDVSYILLNICKQYAAVNVSVVIHGFIEKESVLYKEIYKYFEAVTFAPLPQDYNYKEEILQYPAHYFSHLFAIDSCE